EARLLPASARSALPHRPAALALACTLLAAAAQAQNATEAPAPQQLEAVLVTATRGSKALDRIPGAVGVISRADIDSHTLVSEDPSTLLAQQ
ncbi:hypothetical protein, partial [Klebsiella pneumoniae]